MLLELLAEESTKEGVQHPEVEGTTGNKENGNGIQSAINENEGAITDVCY